MVDGSDGHTNTDAEVGKYNFSNNSNKDSSANNLDNSSKEVLVDVSSSGSVESIGNLVTARGTGEGLVIRLDGRVDADVISTALKEYISSRKGFLTGNNVVLEWVGKKPEEQVVSKVTAILSKDFNIVVSSSRIKGAGGSVGIDGQKAKSSISEFSGEKREGFGSALSNSMPDKSVSLFDGIESIETSHRDDLQQKNDRLTEIPSISPSSPSINKENLAAKGINTGRFSLADESALWDEADARVVGGTLRSGQKIESDHSLVVLGDVNSGAEVVAGGDIVVLGKLRGVAHAGAYDETGGGRFIFALELQPTQLRIGTVISRGSSDGSRSAEIAKVDGNLIVVEPYNARSAVRRNII